MSPSTIKNMPFIIPSRWLANPILGLAIAGINSPTSKPRKKSNTPKKMNFSELLNAIAENGIKKIEASYAFSPQNIEVDKDLIHVIIEAKLLKIGVNALETVGNSLQEKYGCHLGDCYEHPEYLKEILEDVFGESHYTIVNSIIDEIKKHNLDDKLCDFIVCMQEENATK